MSSNIKNNPRSRLERREEDILNAATELFTELGFHATSTRKIAAKAGVSEGTVFHYFSTKNELLITILDRFYKELTSSGQEGIQEIMDTRQRLDMLAENHVNKLMADNSLMMRLLQVSLSVSPKFHTHTRSSVIYQLNFELIKVFDTVIKEGIQRGDLRDDLTLPVCRDVFFGALEYGARTMSLHPEQDRNLYIQALIQPLWENISTASKSTTAPGNVSYEVRMEQACRRIEKAAKQLEKSSG